MWDREYRETDEDRLIGERFEALEFSVVSLTDHDRDPNGDECEEAHHPKRDEALMKAYKRGVKIAFGVDAIWGVEDNPKEFAALVSVGIKPMDALAMATINSAQMLDLD